MIPALLDQATKSDSSANETEKETASVKQQKKKKRKNQITDEQKEKIKAYLDGQNIKYNEEDFKSAKNLREAIYSQLDDETKKEVAKHIEEILETNVARNNKTGNAAKTKPEYDISIYLLRSNNANEAENPETNKPQEPLKDWEKLKEKQMKAFDSIKIFESIEIFKSIKKTKCKDEVQKKLKSIFENLFEKGLQSREYSFYTVPLNEEIINKTFDIISKSEGSLEFHTAYKKAVIEYQQSKFDEWGISKEPAIDDEGNEIGYFITIPQTQEDDPNFVNRYNVIQTHSHNGWCTHHIGAPSYLENHKNVFYIPKESERRIGFTYEDDTIAVIQPLENRGIEKGNSEEIFKILSYNERLLKDLSYGTYINLYRKLNEAQHVDAAIQLLETYLTNLTSDDNLLDKLYAFDLKTLNERLANNDESQKKLNKVNNVYFKAITTQIRKAEKEGKVTNVLSIRDLRNLNQTFRRNLYMAENIQSVNNLYFKALTTQIQKAENEGKVTDVLSTEDLRDLNETFSNSDMAVNIQSVNNLYFEALITQIQKAENEGKVTDVLTIYDLRDLNETFSSDSNMAETIQSVNNLYFEALITQIQKAENEGKKITDVLSISNLRYLNETFSSDSNMAETIQSVNNAYFKVITTQIQKTENEGKKITDVLNIDQLVILNRLYKQENKPESLNALNKAYLEALSTQIQKAENEGKKITDVLSISNLRYLNETFSSDSNMAETIQSVNNAYFKVITTQIQKTENEGKKITDVLNTYDLRDLNRLYLKHLNSDLNMAETIQSVNNLYFEALITQIQKTENEGKKITDVLSAYDLKYLNSLYKQENKPESLNALNITYLTTLLAQNIEDICDEDDLEILNLVFQRSQDQQIQDLLRQINAKMESAQG